MNHLKKYVFIAEITISSEGLFKSLYKTPTQIADGLEFPFSQGGVMGNLQFEGVESGFNTTSFRVLISTKSKNMLEDEAAYVSLVKNFINSILSGDYSYTAISVTKLRIPSMLSQESEKSNIYVDLDGQKYKKRFSSSKYSGIEDSIELRYLSCEEFFSEFVNSYSYSSLHSDMFYADSYSSEKVLELFKIKAREKNVILTDLESFDYEMVFYSDYKNNPDKGLS